MLLTSIWSKTKGSLVLSTAHIATKIDREPFVVVD